LIVALQLEPWRKDRLKHNVLSAPTFYVVPGSTVKRVLEDNKKQVFDAVEAAYRLHDADQQDKAKPIIDKHVADLEAVKNDATLDKAAKRAKVVELRKQYVTDINGILTPDQQKKWAASREANKAKVKSRVKQRAAQKASHWQRECHPPGFGKTHRRDSEISAVFF